MHLELPTDHLVLAGALLLVLGVVGAGIAERLRVPGLILFLVAGMAIGDDGVNWISLSDTELAQGIAVVALVVILYEGGLSSPFGQVRRVLPPALSLTTTPNVASERAGGRTRRTWPKGLLSPPS